MMVTLRRPTPFVDGARKRISTGTLRLVLRYGTMILLVIVVSWYLYAVSTPQLKALHSMVNSYVYSVFGWATNGESQEAFVVRALEDDIYTRPSNGAAIRKLCSSAKWRDDVVISCDKLAGGIGDLKPMLLACVRYSIEAGAILLLPKIHPRRVIGRNRDSFAWDIDLELEYMFDSAHFSRTLATYCPQLQIVEEDNADINIPTKAEAYQITATDLVPVDSNHALVEPKDWRPSLDKRIEEMIGIQDRQKLSSQYPIRISLDGVAFSWPTAYDGKEFVNAWGHMARSPRKIRELAARGLYNLYELVGCLDQDPARLTQGAFLGAHFKTNRDGRRYTSQLQFIRNQLIAYNLSDVYVATGLQADVERLVVDVEDMRVDFNETHDAGVRVFHQLDIFDDDDLAYLKTMTVDEKALVDMDIMLRASQFVGTSGSSWSWTIALKRHAWAQENPYDYSAHSIAFQDEYSVLTGPARAKSFIGPTLYL